VKKIGFIGAGNMAYALASAFSSDNQYSILISDPSSERKELFLKEIPNTSLCDSNQQLVESADIIILAVKPQILGKVLDEIKDPQKRVISIAAGVNLNRLSEAFPKSKLARVMPNTPCLVGEMAAGISFSDNVSDPEKEEILNLLKLAGLVIEIEESQMDALTGVSGSGPAFVARLIESFALAGEKEGLSFNDSYQLALKTFLGTAKLLIEKEMTPEELVKMVSSPNGTTVAGREVLEASEYSSILSKTISAAAHRSRELGAK
jgi:pyrroline-5-carboxylate reductase